MKFSRPLVRGTLVKRYKRFLADVELEDGSVVTAHCANTGSMLGLKEPGITVYLSANDNPRARLAWRWEAVGLADGTIVGINTGHPNRLVEEAVRAGTIGELSGYAEIRREVKYGRNSRIDLLLSGNGRPACYVEVKNVHMSRRPALAEFPDSVTSRGAKHLDEMADMVEQGHRAVMVYLVQRADCQRFSLAGDIDPAYAQGFARARERGVEAIAYACRLSEEEIVVERPLELALD